MWCPVFPMPFIESTLFPLSVLISFVIKKQPCECEITPGLPSALLIHIFVPGPHCFDYCSFMTFEVREHDTSGFVLS